jgi:hypothetical protein
MGAVRPGVARIMITGLVIEGIAAVFTVSKMDGAMDV